MMKVRAMMFTGACAGGCGRHLEHEVGVSVFPPDDDEYGGSWLCSKCTTRLAVRLIAAITDAKSRVRRGYEYRHDKWMKAKPRKPKEKVA